jgi:hypothetical protein
MPAKMNTTKINFLKAFMVEIGLAFLKSGYWGAF